MGKRGPRPEPRVIAMAKNGWRSKLREGEPEEVPGEMLMPDWLGPIAQAKWHETVAVLRERKCESPAYVDFLALYCQAHQDLHDAMETIADQGEYVHSEKGGVYQHPAVGIKHKAIDRIMKFGREFGFSPTSIRDVVMTGAGKADKTKARFFGGTG